MEIQNEIERASDLYKQEIYKDLCIISSSASTPFPPLSQEKHSMTFVGEWFTIVTYKDNIKHDAHFDLMRQLYQQAGWLMTKINQLEKHYEEEIKSWQKKKKQ